MSNKPSQPKIEEGRIEPSKKKDAYQLPRNRITREMKLGLNDFISASKGILTPADYFVAGVEFARKS